ncbi:ParB N-terminal domain-containing protein [Streptomyces sp. SID13666]|uniref:ParB N-terminal domain-containing protein n=1 Tax=Streptomyces sp. SID13666 TaxID=2706054 RepID=UPI0031BA822C
MTAPRWIAYVPLADLHPAERNPKKHELELLIDSIRLHGFVEPAVADERTQRIIAGHGRREALIELQIRGNPLPDGLLLDEDGGWLVPLLRGWNSRTDAEAEALIIKLNRLTERGGWYPKPLAAILEDLVTNDAALFDSLAITDEEMDDLLRQVDPEALPGAINQDAPAPVFDDADDDIRGLSPDDDGRTRMVCCPECSHLFAPGR